MSSKQTISSLNTRRIKNIKLSHPAAFKKGILKEIEDKYYHIISLQDQLYDARDKVRSLEKQLNEVKDDFKFYENICEIEFETEEKEYTTHVSNIGFKGLVYGH